MCPQSAIARIIRGPRAIIGSRDHMPGDLPQRRKVYQTTILNPLPKGCRETAFGFYDYQNYIFTDSFGKPGTYDHATMTLTNSKGVKMPLTEFQVLPLKPRKVERVCIGESVL